MKLPRSVLEKMEKEGQTPPEPSRGGGARSRADEERARRGLEPCDVDPEEDVDACAEPDSEEP